MTPQGTSDSNPPAPADETAAQDSAPKAPTALHGGGLFKRLKHHKVLEWTLAYAALAYTLLHGVEMVAGALNWPHVIVRVLTLLLILGVPVIATLAWYHGAKGLKRLSGGELIIITLLGIIAGSILWAFSGTGTEHQTAQVERSTPATETAAAVTPAAAEPRPSVPAAPRTAVAVLPFANLTGDASKEYLGDGMAEELISTLTKVSGLKVPARTSTFAYKGRNTDIRQIAKDLGVGTILEGSVRAAGKRLRITAQLINAQDGLHLWSESYDEEFTDIFKLQDKLAKAIALALQPNLSGAATEPVTQAPPTQDVEAYNLYLQGVSLVQRSSPQNAARAIEYFQKAIERDPKFARAYAMIAEAHMGWGNLEQPNEHFSAAERAARQALALDPNLANAHNALAGVAINHGQALEMEAHSRAALTLAPNDGFTRVLRANFAYVGGHPRQGLEEAQKAYALAPANPFVVASFAIFQAVAGKDAEALKYAQSARDLGYPQDSLAGVYALTALHAASYPEALASFSKVLHATDPEQARTLEVLRLVFAALQDPAKKEAAIAARTRLYSGVAHRASGAASLQDVSPCLYSAFLYGLLGAVDTVYELADHCFSKMAPGALIINGGFVIDWWTPELRAFRADPRFQGFVTRLGLMEYFQQYGPPDECELKNNKLTCH